MLNTERTHCEFLLLRWSFNIDVNHGVYVAYIIHWNRPIYNILRREENLVLRFSQSDLIKRRALHYSFQPHGGRKVLNTHLDRLDKKKENTVIPRYDSICISVINLNKVHDNNDNAYYIHLFFCFFLFFSLSFNCPFSLSISINT